MVDKILTKEMIEAGAALIKKLDESSIQPDAAFWLYYPDDQKWKLVLAEVKLAAEGPLQIYKKIQETMWECRDQLNEISLDDITLAKPNSPTVNLLRHIIQTGPAISGVRFTNNVVNGNVIDDVYVYRLV
jgi:hypothetical protein